MTFHKPMTLPQAKSVARHLGLTLLQYRGFVKLGSATAAKQIFGAE